MSCQNEQLTMFSDESISRPKSFEDIEKLNALYLDMGDNESDSFTWNEISNGGRSYSFFGNKVFEFYPANDAKYRFTGSFLKASGFTDKEYKSDLYYGIKNSDISDSSFEQMIKCLLDLKKQYFRSIKVDVFACCNDFNDCSDAKECINARERWSNGCIYRQNLENGRIFYGKNRNID